MFQKTSFYRYYRLKKNNLYRKILLHPASQFSIISHIKYLRWKGWDTWTAWFTSHGVWRQRFSSHLCWLHRKYRRMLRARWCSYWMTLQDSVINYLISNSIKSETHITRIYSLTSQTMFNVWFNIKSGQVRLGAEMSCIFSLKLFRKCAPWSFKPNLH